MVGRPPDKNEYTLTPLVLASNDIRRLTFRRGKGTTYTRVIRGVRPEYWEYLVEAAREQGMSQPVYLTVLFEAMRDKRLLILPPGYTLEKFIDGRIRTLIRKETEKIAARVLAETLPTDPYLR